MVWTLALGSLYTCLVTNYSSRDKLEERYGGCGWSKAEDMTDFSIGEAVEFLPVSLPCFLN